jgi:hypothetical protein
VSKKTAGESWNEEKIFHPNLKRAIFGIMDEKVEIDDHQIIDLIDSDRESKK